MELKVNTTFDTCVACSRTPYCRRKAWAKPPYGTRNQVSGPGARSKGQGKWWEPDKTSTASRRVAGRLAITLQPVLVQGNMDAKCQSVRVTGTVLNPEANVQLARSLHALLCLLSVPPVRIPGCTIAV